MISNQAREIISKIDLKELEKLLKTDRRGYLTSDLTDALRVVELKLSNGFIRSQEVRALLESIVDKIDRDGNTLLMICCRHGFYHVAKSLLDQFSHRIDIHSKNSNRWTALLLACLDGNERITEFLIEAGADINYRTPDGQTALIVASRKGCTKIVENLVKKHIDTNIKNKDFETSLILSARNGHTEIIKLLLSRTNVDINCGDKNGNTALIHACYYQHIEVVDFILGECRELDVDRCNNNGQTALYFACDKNNIELIIKLLKVSEEKLGSYISSALLKDHYVVAIILETANFSLSDIYRLIGDCYLLGVESEKNYVAALRWYTEAAMQKDANAMLHIAIMYLKGIGFNRDFEKAVDWLYMSIQSGNEWISDVLILYHIDIKEEEYAKISNLDERLSIKLVRKNSEEFKSVHYLEIFNFIKEDISNIFFRLGRLCFEKKGRYEEIRDAYKIKGIELYKKAAALGDFEAMFSLGHLYQSDQGVEHNDQKAVYWFKKAANLGHERSMYFLGLAYRDGKGVEPNEEESIRWFRSAASLGEVLAIGYLSAKEGKNLDVSSHKKSS